MHAEYDASAQGSLPKPSRAIPWLKVKPWPLAQARLLFACVHGMRLGESLANRSLAEFSNIIPEHRIYQFTERERELERERESTLHGPCALMCEEMLTGLLCSALRAMST